MANFPMIPMTLALDDCTTIIHNGSRLVITGDGEMFVEGRIKDAAVGLVKYVIWREYTPGLVSFELNKAVRIDLDKGITLKWIGDKKEPEFFAELVTEFKRTVKMKMFW